MLDKDDSKQFWNSDITITEEAVMRKSRKIGKHLEEIEFKDTPEHNLGIFFKIS